MEPPVPDAPNAAHEVPTFDSPVRVTFIHYRKRLCDVDGLSGKAVLDAIVTSGILADDSPGEIAEVRHRQVKSKIEYTRVIIEAIQ